MTNKHATVIGAGIVGVSAAAWLQRAGFTVRVIDSLAPGNGCSFGNAGNISPGQIVPYSMPGVLKSVPKWLLSPSGPLRIRPTYFPKLLPWLLKWMDASKAEEVLRISRAMHSIHSRTFDAYDVITKNTSAADQIIKPGQLYVSEKVGGAEGTPLAQQVRREMGVEAIALNAEQIRERVPEISPSFRSGLFFPGNGRCKNPYRLVLGIAEAVARNGGEFVQDRIVDMTKVDGRVVAIRGEKDTYEIDQLVIAAGAASKTLAGKLGDKVPLEAERGYHVVIENPDVRPEVGVTNRDWGFACSLMDVGLRVAGTVEYAGLNAPPNWRRADLLVRQARQMFPSLTPGNITRWIGSRPTLPDSLPVLDRASKFANAYYAFGNSHFGMSAGPVMGMVLAEMMTGAAPSIDISPFRAGRFN